VQFDTTAESLQNFQKFVWNFYKQERRIFEWRETINPYHIVVSEIMLQQTQTSRVVEKYNLFIKTFPTFESLAKASFKDVLKIWVGLGYNRRAQALQGIAQIVVNDHNGIMPRDPETLQTFKGLGPATSSSIVTFAFNKPTVFIETNVRAVFLHTFFKDQDEVHDKELMPLIACTVDAKNPREWYYALMDYGVHLKKTYKNPSKKSKHHQVQSTFKGSDRQIRGAVLRQLTTKESILFKDIHKEIPWATPEKIETIFSDLSKEQLIILSKSRWFLK
jgi:A/G-specific adenine glycosylase